MSVGCFGKIIYGWFKFYLFLLTTNYKCKKTHADLDEAVIIKNQEIDTKIGNDEAELMFYGNVVCPYAHR